jgi:hypothetical protein
MNAINKIAIFSMFLAPSLLASGQNAPMTILNCSTLNPTICSPNGGVLSGPFYGCDDNMVDCCWTKEVQYNCGASAPYTPTWYYFRFKGIHKICPPIDPSGGCIAY